MAPVDKKAIPVAGVAAMGEVKAETVSYKVLLISEEAYRASVETGSCALCGAADAGEVLAFRKHDLRDTGLLPFNVCWPGCAKRCSRERVLGDDHWNFEFQVAGTDGGRVCLRRVLLYGPDKCPTCGRVVCSTNRGRYTENDDHDDSEPCCWAHRKQGPSRLSRERLEARQDRRCEQCGATFTPKNSLGKTCSARCRVALHRERQAQEERKAERQAEQKARRKSRNKGDKST
jgi:hypothetical protein